MNNLNGLDGFVYQATFYVSAALWCIPLSRVVVHELAEFAIFVCDEWRRVKKRFG